MQVYNENGLKLPSSKGLTITTGEVIEVRENLYRFSEILTIKGKPFNCILKQSQYDELLESSIPAENIIVNNSIKIVGGSGPETIISTPKLTELQVKIKEQMDKGLDIPAIAQLLEKPEKTIQNSITEINKKLGTVNE